MHLSKLLKPNPNPARPSCTLEIKPLMNQRDNAHRIAHKTHNARDWLIFGNIKRQVKTRLKLAESDFVWNEIQTNKNDPSGLWKTIKRCLPIYNNH